MIVRFFVRHGAYNPGERAGFTDAVAQQLIAAGLAVEAHEGDPGDADLPAVASVASEPEVDDGDVAVLGDRDREPAPGSGMRPRRARR